MGRLVLVVVLCAAAACSDHPTTPTASTATLPGPAPPTGPSTLRSLRGYVQDTAFRSLADARVDVVAGPLAGRWATTDANGAFAIAGEFDDSAVLRASKGGYVDQTEAINGFCQRCNPSGYVMSLSLGTRASTPDLRGDYELTIRADEHCTQLPPEAMSRTYLVHIPGIAPGGQVVALMPSGAVLAPDRAHLQLGVAADRIAVWITALEERLGPDAAVLFGEIGGSIAAPESLARLDLELEGNVMHCAAGDGASCLEAPRDRVRTCFSSRHRAVLMRR
ncbi:MAG: carboxypeptidase-like regulatory domain-containing protein [Vicinamibacterales bacterium]